jgi:hypothetical protein
VGFVGGETGYCSETCVTGGVGGTGEGSVMAEDAVEIKEEVSVKFEAIYIKDEIAETATCPPVKTDHEVRLGGVAGGSSYFEAIYCPKKEIVNLHLTVSCFVLYCICRVPFDIWMAILKRGDVLEVITINGSIIFKCILK